MGEDEVDEVFRGVCMAQMSNDGRLKRVHDSTVTLEVCPRQYDAEIRVVKGCQFLCSGVRYVHSVSCVESRTFRTHCTRLLVF